MATPALSCRGLTAGYGDIQVLWGVDLEVPAGQVVALLGTNGAGKTTTLKAISGLLRRRGGEVRFEGQDISRLEPHKIADLGLVHVPEGRRVFPFLSVQENLEMGAFGRRARPYMKDRMAQVYDLFPVLKKKRSQPANVLSGGEQQMLAIGRGLMASPKLLMLDEPSLGLAPKLVETLFETLGRIAVLGVTLLLVEQNVFAALELAQTAFVLDSGRTRASGAAADLLQDDNVRRTYLGV